MKKVGSSDESMPKPRRRRAVRNPESRMKQLVSLAVDLIEERLLNGTATSQETTTLIRYATSHHKLEEEMMEEKINLMKTKRESIESAKRTDEMYGEVLAAIRSYSGITEEDLSDEDIF